MPAALASPGLTWLKARLADASRVDPVAAGHGIRAGRRVGMSVRRLLGVVLSLVSAIVLGVLIYESAAGPPHVSLIYAIGMAWALVLGMLATVTLAFGIHLMASRGTRRPSA